MVQFFFPGHKLGDTCKLCPFVVIFLLLQTGFIRDGDLITTSSLRDCLQAIAIESSVIFGEFIQVDFVQLIRPG